MKSTETNYTPSTLGQKTELPREGFREAMFSECIQVSI